MPPRENRDRGQFNCSHPNTAFDPKVSTGQPPGAGAALDEDRGLAGVAADLVSEDRAAHEIPREMQAEREPEVVVALVREAEQDAAEEDVREAEQRDRSVAGVEGGEDEGDEEVGDGAVDLQEFLKGIAAEEQLFVERGGGEDGQELEPRKSAARFVAYVRGENDEHRAAADEKDAPCEADEEFARGGKRPDEEAERPAAVLPDGNREDGGDGDGDQASPVPEREAEPLQKEQCGNIETKEQEKAEGSMSKYASDVAALLLRLAAGLIFIPHGWSKVAGEGGPASFAADMAANYHLPAFLGYVAAYAELVGGALLIAGLLTRLDAFLLAATMFVAAFIVQLPDALYEVPPGAIKLFVALRGIETPLAMFAICVALVFLGGGRFSLDHLGVRWRSHRSGLPKAVAVPPHS